MKLLYLDAANSEFDEAIAYYNIQSAGLGFEFADEIKEAIERIKNYPEAWTPLSGRVRRCQVHRFPYSVIYQVRAELLIIVAIQRHSRKPENWRNRLT
jgi:plasmid stabilization system protein ParE